MNPQEMIRLVDGIARERNIDKELLFDDLEQALVSAARKHFDAADTEEFTAQIDRQTGEIRVWRGQDPIPLEELGRIPAQTAKQVMIQRFREDERASVYSEFVERVGELATGMAQRYEGGALVVQIDRAEGFMPRSEQIPGEQYQPGERVRCLILDCREEGNQVKIVLSRASPQFIRRLFEVEVPEVSERIIEIKSMSREAGYRTKIAVASIDSKVDAVGACVGVRGSRIKNIVDELGGEKIDIVRWNESSQILIQNALKPAEIVEISLCFELGRATVVVNEDQLSLAIGKRGQNVRLAARLTGWDVDVLTPAEFTRALDTMEQTLGEVEGVTADQIDRLAAFGVTSVFDVEEVGPDFLVNSIECTHEQGQKMVELASEKAKEVAEQQRERTEAERVVEQGEGEDAGGIVDMLEQGSPSGSDEAATQPAEGGEAAPASPAASSGGGEGGSLVDALESPGSASSAEGSSEGSEGPAGEEASSGSEGERNESAG